MRTRRWHGWSVIVIWTQWALPLKIWWWPVSKDLAFGVHVGPVQLQWTREWI